MMTKRVMFSLAASVVSFSLAADFADSEEDRVALLECKMKKVHQDSVYERGGARFATGRAQINGYGFEVEGNYLYWKPFEGGTDAAVVTDANFFQPATSSRVKSIDFDWKSGYRLGASYAWPENNWEFALVFTRIKPKGDVSANESPLGVAQLFGFDIPDGADVTAGWQIKYSVLDGEIARNYFVSRHLYLRPFFGVRTGWIKQSAEANYSYQDFVQLTNVFRGVGLRVGADSKWYLGKGVNFFLSTSAAGLYGEFFVRTYRNDPTEPFLFNIREHLYRIVPTLQSAIGMGYEVFFACDHNMFAVNLAYELNYWWRQNQLGVYENSFGQPFGMRNSSDLGFHGLTLDFRLDF